jgi:outer membrane lipoprotein SlyB
LAALKRPLLISGLLLTGLSACAPSYSPDTYASSAVQQANKVEQGVVIGVRDVAVTAAGTAGAVTGAAAGGIAGSQMGVGTTSAFASLGGALVGGIAGTTVEHVTADTKAFEYIVRKENGELVSVTQKDRTPLALGQHVLVIAGSQARVVPDYTVPPEVAQAKPGKAVDPGKPVEPDLRPADAAPVDNKPTEATPATAKPADAIPAAAVPAGAIPAVAMPADGAPTLLHPVNTDATTAEPVKPVEIRTP